MAAKPPRRAPRANKPGVLDRLSVRSLAGQVRAWADSALGIANAATDLQLAAAKGAAKTPARRAMLARAGKWLQRARTAAGYSLGELGRAIDLKDPELLALVETGRIALPFEIILRLSAVLGRNDPIAFAMNLTRASRPELWRALEDLGVGRLLLQSARERAFANVLRAHDAARNLNDAEFAALLKLVDATVQLALTFRAGMRVSPRRAARG
jgi:transcriptional regulator with XRE-family HTH domain